MDHLEAQRKYPGRGSAPLVILYLQIARGLMAYIIKEAPMNYRDKVTLRISCGWWRKLDRAVSSKGWPKGYGQRDGGMIPLWIRHDNRSLASHFASREEGR